MNGLPVGDGAGTPDPSPKVVIRASRESTSAQPAVGRLRRRVPRPPPCLNAPRVGRDSRRRRRERGGRGSAGISVRAKWAIAFLIGLATVTAASFTWRAAQIGSTAAYDDRQSISETVRAEQGEVERTIAIAAAAREYVRYRADYGVAAALDREAARLAAAGSSRLADVSRAEAAALREGATRRAAEAGVFGRATIGSDLLKPSATPRSFDIKARRRALEAEQSTALDSPGKLNPSGFAQTGGRHPPSRQRSRPLRVRDRLRRAALHARRGIDAPPQDRWPSRSPGSRSTPPRSWGASRPTSSHERAAATGDRREPQPGEQDGVDEVSDPLKPKIAVTLAVVVVIAGMLAVLQTQAGANESTTARETTRTAVRAMSANVATSTLLGVRSVVQAEHDFLPFRRPLDAGAPSLTDGRRTARRSRTPCARICGRRNGSPRSSCSASWARSSSMPSARS